jgi:hypothetical protein
VSPSVAVQFTGDVKAKDPALSDRKYRKQPDALDSKQVAEDLGPDAILLC